MPVLNAVLADMNGEYDVAIIGGGPAGSCAATFLAKAGKRVLVLEREQFPRFHIGESLLPFSLETLDRLGIRPKLNQGDFLPKYGAEVVAGCGSRESRFYFRNGHRPVSDTAYQVTRADFDKLLLDHAAESGAEVREGVTVRVVDPEERPVRLETSAGEFRCRFLIDASGRNSLVASKYGLRKPYPGLNKFAIFAHYAGATLPEGIDGTLTRMVRESDRWFWAIPLGGNRISIGLIVDRDRFRSSGQSAADYFEAAIAAQPAIRERLAEARRTTKIHASGDYSYRMERMAGDRWLLAGDAAGFIDPVFSSGVFLALLSGERAAEAILCALDDPRAGRRAFRRYERDLRRVMRLYLRFVRGWYSQEFIETLLNPQEHLGLVPAVNAVLAGNLGTDFSIRWRLTVFRAIVWLQKRLPLSPRLSLTPGPAASG